MIVCVFIFLFYSCVFERERDAHRLCVFTHQNSNGGNHEENCEIKSDSLFLSLCRGRFVVTRVITSVLICVRAYI